MAMIYTINSAEKNHLDQVKEEMALLGSPKVRAVWCGDHYRAIEGSHRVAAAAELGHTVEVIDVDLEDVIADHDIQDLPYGCTVEEIMDYCSYTAAAYDVEII